jgi:hypothetical protein
MNEPDASVTIVLRIPGTWSNPRELLERLPEGCRLTGEALILPDATEVTFDALEVDAQFPSIFYSSCRDEPSADERAIVDNYCVNVVLGGAGGSLEAARALMQAGAAIVRAGGAGVFIDNSALAHGASRWLDLADDGSPDALSFAYVALVADEVDVWTMGMHVLGLRDVVMKRIDADAFNIIDVIRYLCEGDRPVDDGHVIADLNGPRFQVCAVASETQLAGSPLHNPFGRLKLVNVRDIAEKS